MKKYEGKGRYFSLMIVAALSFGAVFSLGGALSAARTGRLRILASNFAAERSAAGFAARDRAREGRLITRAFSLKGQTRMEGFVAFLPVGFGNDAETVMVLVDRNGRPLAARMAEGWRRGAHADPAELGKMDAVAEAGPWALLRAFGGDGR
jgi:hypothetical protein